MGHRLRDLLVVVLLPHTVGDHPRHHRHKTAILTSSILLCRVRTPPMAAAILITRTTMCLSVAALCTSSTRSHTTRFRSNGLQHCPRTLRRERRIVIAQVLFAREMQQTRVVIRATNTTRSTTSKDMKDIQATRDTPFISPATVPTSTRSSRSTNALLRLQATSNTSSTTTATTNSRSTGTTSSTRKRCRGNSSTATRSGPSSLRSLSGTTTIAIITNTHSNTMSGTTADYTTAGTKDIMKNAPTTAVNTAMNNAMNTSTLYTKINTINTPPSITIIPTSTDNRPMGTITSTTNITNTPEKWTSMTCILDGSQSPGRRKL